MKKRKLKIKNILIAFFLLIAIIVGLIIGIPYLIKDKEETKEPEKIEEVKEELPKEKRMSLVAVGDALIHAALYLDASTGNNTYDFSYMFTEVEP